MHSEARPKISSLRQASHTATPPTKNDAPYKISGLGLANRLQTQSPVLMSRKIAAKPAIAYRKCTHLRSIVRYLFALCWALAGEEGFEPPTRGFGDRCSTIRATRLETSLTTEHGPRP